MKAREIGAGYDRLRALFHKGRLLGNRGRISDALDVLDEAIRLAERVGDRRWPSRLRNTQAWLLCEVQDLQAALRLDMEAAQIASSPATQRASAIHTSMRRAIAWHSASQRAPWSTCGKPNDSIARISGSGGFTSRVLKENSRAIGSRKAISSKQVRMRRSLAKAKTPSAGRGRTNYKVILLCWRTESRMRVGMRTLYV